VISARSQKVLVVEDESIVAHDLQQTLVGMGYDAFAIASSAEEAIARASEKCPDAVLMDIRIKGDLDGIATAGLLQERFGVPVVYLTAHADETTIERAKKTLPYGYLLKPVKSAELRSAIEVALYKHEMDRRLRERERWFGTTLRSIADAVITVDLGGRITFMNPAAESLTGWKIEAALGHSAHDVVRLVDKNASEIEETPLDRALRDGNTPDLLEAGIVSAADGQTRPINDSASRVMDRNEALGAVMVFRDVTEHKRLQSQLELTDRLVSLGTMAAGVAHEVNNPLGVVVSGAELVGAELKRQRESLDTDRDLRQGERSQRLDKAIRMLSLVQSAASRIGTIVSQLSAFARPRPQAASQASVERAVEWAIWTTSRELNNRARLVRRLEPVPPVKADESRLGQVLVNLLINAAQAIPPGDVEHNEVSITTRRDGRGWVVVEVRDTGAGIPPEIIQRIFEPFFTTKAVGSGTGLGLSICHGIVASLGGELTLESRVGEGSLFRVTLPPAPIEEIREAPLAEARALPRGRILVIDDEETLLEIISDTLSEHEVVCTSKPKEALRLIEVGERFDVIFCDLMMPQMTGMDLYEAILRLRPDYAPRMVFMTGGATTARSDDFLHTVPNPTIVKPFSATALQGALEQVFRKE
jgi:two-component system, cell cycle sensor histidine kinase and response regulator CckA